MPAELKAPGSRKWLAEDQASAVVESFERLGVELVDAALLPPRLGGAGFYRPPS